MTTKELTSTSQTLQTAEEISRILNTGLDKEALSLIIALCEEGVNPEALAEAVKELRRESQSTKVSAATRSVNGSAVGSKKPTLLTLPAKLPSNNDQ